MDNASDFVLFLGRFHPIVVHFPIGFLVFAFLLELYGRWKKNPLLASAVPFALLCGAISALVACILGYLLSLSGEYEENALDTHFWFGVATTVIAFLAWGIKSEKIKIPNLNKIKPSVATLTLVVLLVGITGHYGGNLTHGSDYLVKYAPFGQEEKKELAAITTVEEAVVFDYLVAPILQQKCASCHNSGKKKGGLSYEDRDAILKGGKNGPVFMAGNASESEMIHRVLLDPEHEDFMPPEGKTPLTEDEKAILMYWIDKGNADFDTKIATVETSDDILGIASTMLGIKGVAKKGETVALPAVGKVPENVMENVLSQGFKLRELVFDSGFYEVVLPPKTVAETDKLTEKLQSLLAMKDNILWLYLEDNNVGDAHLQFISKLQNLQKLKLNKNPITDKSIAGLTDHANINSLNLYGTKITKASLEAFSKMQNLERVYVWETGITKEDIVAYKDNDDYPEVVF